MESSTPRVRRLHRMDDISPDISPFNGTADLRGLSESPCTSFHAKTVVMHAVASRLLPRP